MSWSPVDVLTSFVLAAVLFFAIGFPAEPFNKTLEENRHRLPTWLRRDPPAELRSNGWLHLAGFILFGAALLSLVENGAGFNGRTLVLALALLIAVPLTTLAYSGTAELYLRGSEPESGKFHVLALGLAIAAMCVLISQAAGFQPGYVYGLFAFFATAATVVTRREPRQGASVLWASVTLLVLGVAAWLLWAPVADAAEQPGAGLDVLLLDSVLAATFVLALQGVVFGLIPIEFMDGKKLRRWRWPAWAAVWGVALFLFVHILFNKFLTEYEPAKVVAFVAPFLLFGLLSAGLWLYLRLTRPDPQPEPEDDDTDDVDTGPI